MASFFNSLGNNIVLLTIIPFVIVAVVLLLFAMRGRRKAAAARNWPTAMGRVLSADVETRRSSSSEGGYTTSYYPNVLYEYQVDGKSYRSNQFYVAMPVGLGNYAKVHQQVLQYPVGSMVEVYYNPADPTQAALVPSAPSSSILIWVVVLIVVILAVTVAFTMGIMNMVGGFMPN
jgi:hypothetical protein